MKVIFLGTSDFSKTVLEYLAESKHEIVLVVTNPDRPGTRGKISLPPAKILAEEMGLKVFQTASVSKDGVEVLKNCNADIIVTASFGQILTQEVLDICPHGVINTHASLLPLYRGASPIQQAIIDGRKETGVTIMKTVLALDAGDVILSKAIPILQDDTAETCFSKLACLAGELVVEALDDIENNTATYTPQQEEFATFTKIIKKSDGELDFNRNSLDIANFVRGMYPWPSAFTYLNDKILKVLLTSTTNNIIINKDNVIIGTVVCANTTDGLWVKTRDGVIEIVTLQAEGKRAMSAKDYLRGNPIEVGTVLGR